MRPLNRQLSPALFPSSPRHLPLSVHEDFRLVVVPRGDWTLKPWPA